jgi:hypothetical protein
MFSRLGEHPFCVLGKEKLNLRLVIFNERQ